MGDIFIIVPEFLDANLLINRDLISDRQFAKIMRAVTVAAAVDHTKNIQILNIVRILERVLRERPEIIGAQPAAAEKMGALEA